MGVKIRLPDSVFDAFSGSDPQCTLKAGDRIRKNCFAEGDMQQIGEEGTVKGVAYNENLGGEILLVHIDGHDEDTHAITLPYKFDLI